MCTNKQISKCSQMGNVLRLSLELLHFFDDPHKGKSGGVYSYLSSEIT